MEETPSLVYTPSKKAHLFFYSKTPNNETHLLLFKQTTTDYYETVSTELTDYDNAPTFAIGRQLVNLFNKLFTKEILDKITSNQPLTQDDIARKSEVILPYEIWKYPSYIYWLDTLSTNLVQYDNIPEEVIYFKEIPYITLTDFNKQLQDLKYYVTFDYINISNYSSFNIGTTTLTLFNALPIDKMINHIETSEMNLKEDKCDLYIVLACKRQGNDQVGFFHFPALFQGIYRKNNEKWLYMIAASGLPSEELLSKCKCLIIPGSELSVNNDIQFLRDTEAYLKQLITDIYSGKYPQLKFLGICFGMQIFFTGIGGKVANIGKGKAQRFPETVRIDPSFWELQFVKDSGVVKRDTMKICEAHGDYIDTWPEEFKVNLYGTSDSCRCEVMGDTKEKVFLIQGHPEYHPQFLVNRAVDWYLSFEKKEPNKENIEAYIEKYNKEEYNQNVDSIEWRKLCYTFMKKPK
jgi:GMP synthase-like glutamine amidotransferase